MQTAQYNAAHHQSLALGFGFSFNDLYDRDGLIRVDAAFLDFLGESDAALRAQLEAARLTPTALSGKAQSGTVDRTGASSRGLFGPVVPHRNASAGIGRSPS